MKDIERAVLCEIHTEETAEFLQAIIRANSCYPPGDTRTVAEVCREKLAAAGIEAQLVYPPDDLAGELDDHVCNAHIPSVLATLGDGSGKRMVWNAHIDTVPVEDAHNWRQNPFCGAIETEDGTDYVYGRGAGDDKGSVAAQVMAMIALKRAGVTLKGTLTVNPVADEEGHGKRGTAWLLHAGYYGKPDVVVIGEQTNGEVAIAERAYTFSRIVVKGKACHGAMPWNGNNAVVKAARIVDRINRELEPKLAKRTHPYLPHSTINVSGISGGVKENVVPELAQIKFDRRIVPGETLQGALDEVEALVQSVQREEPFAYELHADYLSGMPTNTAPDDPLVQSMLATVREVSGRDAQPTGYQQGSDARYFAPLGVPIAIYGPSDPAVGHSPNERVSVAQLVETAKVYALTALRVLGAQ